VPSSFPLFFVVPAVLCRPHRPLSFFVVMSLSPPFIIAVSSDPPRKQLLPGVGVVSQGAGHSSGGGARRRRRPLVAFLPQATPRAVAQGAGCGWCIVRRCRR
jgi:hypothetical protein